MTADPIVHCWPWKHTFTPWTTYVWTGTKDGVGITATKQARVCTKCQWEEHRIVDGAHGYTYKRVQEETTSAK